MDSETLRQRAHQNAADKAQQRASYASLLAAIWEAHDEGWPQVAIVRHVGLTRERVRQICDPEYRARHRDAAVPGMATPDTK